MKELCKEWGPKLKITCQGAHGLVRASRAPVPGASGGGVLAPACLLRILANWKEAWEWEEDEVGSEELRSLLAPHPGPP